MDTELEPVENVESVDTAYLALLAYKGHRAKRRLDTALREPGRLRAWLNLYDLRWWWMLNQRNSGLFKQQMRAGRHSCHAMCCAYKQAEKRERNRRSRYDARVALQAMLKGKIEG